MAAAAGASPAVSCPCEGDDEEPGDATALDDLPLELLVEVASWLELESLLSLERVSARCGDAVSLHLARVRTLRAGSRWAARGAELTALLPRLTALRQLHVWLPTGGAAARALLSAVAAAADCWPRLERLTLRGTGLAAESELVSQLCAACPRLTDVTLDGDADDVTVSTVLDARPDLRALTVTGRSPRGLFLHELPTGLHRLSIDCRGMVRWSAGSGLARCGELRSLELRNFTASREPSPLAEGLSGCVRLERLALPGCGAVSACLPAAGLCALRRLEVPDCGSLRDAQLAAVVSRLPQLEAVSVARCRQLTPRGLALLGQLAGLRQLDVRGAGGVSDWSLARLSAAPLTELQLGAGGTAFCAAVTAEGLLSLTRSCPTLRALTLWADDELAERVPSGPDADEHLTLRWLRVRLLKMADLAMFSRRVEEWAER